MKEKGTSTLLKAQSYLRATYSGGSICVSGSSVQEDTYSGGSICERCLLVHRLQHRATYSGGSICECGLSVHSVTDCSHRAITIQFAVVEVLVKVACQSTTVTD